jgi:hypothetical protein
MKSNSLGLKDYEQIDLFYEEASEDLSDKLMDESAYDPWDITRGRNIIKALGKDGKDVTLYFDALDQQYHLFDE